jgi:hypothetical protein
VTALSDLRAAIGDSHILAIYDASIGVTLVGGKVTQWDDARGAAGFGPSFTGFGAVKPDYDATNKIISTSGSNWLATPLSSAFDQAGGADRSFAAIAAATAGAFYGGINSSPMPYNSGALAYLAMFSGDGANYTGLYNSESFAGGQDGATLRLGIADARLSAVPGTSGPGSGYAWAETWGRGRTIQGGGAAGVPGAAGNRLLSIGGLVGAGPALVNGAAIKVQFIIFIDRALTDADHAAIIAYATTAPGLAPVIDNSKGLIAADGNSLTYGLTSSSPGQTGTTAWPSVLKASHADLANYDIMNYGVSGQSGTTMLAVTPLRLFSSYNPARPKNIYVYWEGNNDIGNSAAVMQAHIHDLCLAAKTKGFTVIVATTIASGSFGAPEEAKRLANNTYIRGAVAGGWADAVWDVAANPHFQNPADTTYYSGDTVHLTDVGQAEAANHATYGIYPVIAALIAGSGTIVSDQLNDADGTLLTAHPPNLGFGWVQQAGPANSVQIRGNGLYVAVASYTWSLYKLKKTAAADGGYGIADYMAGALAKYASMVAGTFLVAARITGTGYECYAAGWERGVGYRIVKFDAAGNFTVLTTLSSPSLPAAPKQLDLIAYGTGASVTLVLRVAGSVVGRYTDSTSPYTAGIGGVALYSIDGAVPPTGVFFDSFAVDPVPTGALLPTVTTQPTGGPSGVPLPSQGVVTIEDIAGATVASDTRTITAFLDVVSGSGAITAGTLTKACVAGVANFAGNGITVTGSGHFRIGYDAGDLGVVYSSEFIGTPTPTKLTITTQPAGFASGSSCTTPAVVKVTDAGGLVDTTWQGKIVAEASGSGAAKISGPTMVQLATFGGQPTHSGVATFRRVALRGPGETNTITYTAFPDPGFPSLAPVVSAPITVGAAIDSFATFADGTPTTAALPRVTPVMPTFVADVTVTVSAAALQAKLNLDGALDAAHGGTLNRDYLVPDLTSAVGNYTIPLRPADATGYLRVRCEGAFPTASGSRPLKADMGTRAVLRANAGSLFATAVSAGGLVAKRFILEGLTLGVVPGANVFCLVQKGTGGPDQDTLAKVPEDIWISRCVLDGTSTGQIDHAVLPWCKGGGIVDCSMYDIHSHTNDDGGHGITFGNGPGPYLVDNVDHESAGIPIIMSAEVTIPGLIPSDLTLRRVRLTRPFAWQGIWKVKTNVDLKNCQRVLFEAPIIENCWVDAWNGPLTNIKSVNQYNQAPWCGTSDVTFRNPFLRNGQIGFFFGGSPEAKEAANCSRVAVINPLLVNVPNPFQADGGDTMDIEIDHPTALPGTSSSFGGAYKLGSALNVARRHRFTNVMAPNYGGYFQETIFPPEVFSIAHTPGLRFTKNVFGPPLPGYSMTNANYNVGGGTNYVDQGPAGAPVTLASVQFVDTTIVSTWDVADPVLVAAALALQPTSPYHNLGTDGFDIGADMTALAAALGGTFTPPVPLVATSLAMVREAVGGVAGLPFPTQAAGGDASISSACASPPALPC